MTKNQELTILLVVDVLLLLFVAMVLKERKEEERYRLIDAKTGHI